MLRRHVATAEHYRAIGGRSREISSGHLRSVGFRWPWLLDGHRYQAACPQDQTDFAVPAQGPDKHQQPPDANARPEGASRARPRHVVPPSAPSSRRARIVITGDTRPGAARSPHLPPGSPRRSLSTTTARRLQWLIRQRSSWQLGGPGAPGAGQRRSRRAGVEAQLLQSVATGAQRVQGGSGCASRAVQPIPQSIPQHFQTRPAPANATRPIYAARSRYFPNGPAPANASNAQVHQL